MSKTRHSEGITIRELVGIRSRESPKHRIFNLDSVICVNPFSTCPNCYSSNITQTTRHDPDGKGYLCNNCSSTHYIWLCDD